MKIAQVAPLYESVPPRLYGGTERIVSFLTEELVSKGHEVTLFASGDSITAARLEAVVPQALRLNKNCVDTLAPHIIQMLKVLERADEFDLIHFHTDYLNFPFLSQLKTAHVTTLHGRLDIPELQMIYDQFPHVPVVSISQHQRSPLPQANFVSTVYHGLPKDLFQKGSGGGGYLAFIGRISPEKRCDRAIKLAIEANLPLKIAAKIDKADEDYFQTEIKHLFDHPLVEYVGEVNEIQKQDFLGNARALLFPIDWPEPFGLVMIEAMACGTPVIAWNRGSVPEVMTNSETGFIVNSMEEAADAIKNLNSINRDSVREVFDQRFTASLMADNYLKLYQQLIQAKAQKPAKFIPIDFDSSLNTAGVKAVI